MDHKENLRMYFFNELTGSEKAELEKHLQECNECKAELEELKKLRTFLSLKKQNITDKLLGEARQELRARLRIEKKRRSFSSIVKDLVSPFYLIRPAYAFGAVAILASGILAGYFLFKSTAISIDQNELASADNKDLKISNVKFIDSDLSDGEVEFTFDAVKPVRVKGNINDEQIKTVLMFAMLNEENPGVRLNTVNFINEARPGSIDPEVKAAVLTVAKFDENPGVRKEAFTFLKKLPFDEDIKEAYLYVLMNDSVSGLRIEAVNGLFAAARQGELFTKEELSVFKEKMKEDDNSYIRLRAQTVLKEYN